MVLIRWHRNDFRRLSSENEKERESDEYRQKLEKGPVGMLTVISADYQLGRKLVSWFLYSILVGLFTAYLTGRAVGPGAQFLEVFRFSGATAFGAYSLALLQNSIWYGRRWGATLRSVLDGFVYAVVTAGTFGWFWPQV
jgi:hypothetical protein